MEAGEDKNWASRYLLDPLNEPDPSAETGPGSSFRPQAAPKPSAASQLPSPPTSPTKPSRNPFRRDSTSSKQTPAERQPGMISSLNRTNRSTSLSSKGPPISGTETELPYRSASQRMSHSRNTSGAQPTPSRSASGAQAPPSSYTSSPTHRQDAFGDYASTNQKQSPNASPEPNLPVSGRRRGSSLGQRYAGDNSNQPLAQLSREKYIADKSRHLIRKHHIQPDQIDSLDTISPDGKSYHHSGPYDATLFARNNSYLSSPLQAVHSSNAEALKATPKDKIMDSVRGHRPLDGVATFPPGTTDRDGNTYNYAEGENMMIGGGHEPEGGAYKRWPGMQYHPDDIKGKGEPSYTIEKNLKESERSQRSGEGGEGIEMTSPTERAGTDYRSGMDVNNEGIPRRTSTSKRLSGGLRKRVGSITKHLRE